MKCDFKMMGICLIFGFSLMNESKASAEIEIKKVIGTYVEGYLKADSALISEAFHEDTKLLSVDEGKLDQTSMVDWKKNLDQRRASNDIRSAKLEIKRIDITQNAATVKLKLTFEKLIFTDYLSLLKLADRWIIVGKIYEVEARPKDD